MPSFSNAFRWPLLLLSLVVSSGLLAEDAKPNAVLSRSCRLYSQPNLTAKVACEQRVGTSVTTLEVSEGGFVRIQAPACVGFIPNSCLAAVGGGRLRNPASGGGVEGTALQFRLGVGGSGGGNWASVGYADGYSAGYQFGTYGNAALVIGRIRVRGLISAHYMRLTREIDASGKIVETDHYEVTQSYTYFGWTGLAGFRVNPLRVTRRENDTSFWLEAGGELLIPISAKQRDNLGGEASFKTSDRQVNLLFGPSADIPIARFISVTGHFHGFVNLAGKNGSRTLGMRLGVGLDFTI